MQRRVLAETMIKAHLVAAVLNRQRPLTLAMIRRLHRGLGIPADVLIQPYEVVRRRA